MASLRLYEKAMTLPEIIIIVMLVSVVIGAGIMPFVMQQGMIRTQMARSNIQDQVSITMAYINKDVLPASRADIPIGGATLTLEIRSTTNVLSDTIVYARSGSAISRTHTDHTVTPAVVTTRNIAENITGLTFTPQGNNLVDVSITAADANNTQTLTSSTAMALRVTRAIS